MTILDLRPSPVRLWTRSQEGRAVGGNAPCRPARWAARLTDLVVARRVGRRMPPPPGLAVISVGNLAFGGTGKTPVVAALARELAARGRSGGVLTRGYGSRQPGPCIVAPTDPTAGDEARLLAGALAAGGWLVVQSRDRWRGLELLARELPQGAVVLLEDGHQTARVGRHLDVLILDRWATEDTRHGPELRPQTGPVAPFGPWRESAAGAARAEVWLVEAADPLPAAPRGRAVTGFQRRLSLHDGRGIATPPPHGAPWVALSGIARPWAFEASAAALCGGPPLLAIRCADHAPYGPALRSRIAAAIAGVGAPLTVTTEKDWIKLQPVWPAELPVAVARLDVEWTGARTLPDLVGERCDACRE